MGESWRSAAAAGWDQPFGIRPVPAQSQRRPEAMSLAADSTEVEPSVLDPGWRPRQRPVPLAEHIVTERAAGQWLMSAEAQRVVAVWSAVAAWSVAAAHIAVVAQAAVGDIAVAVRRTVASLVAVEFRCLRAQHSRLLSLVLPSAAEQVIPSILQVLAVSLVQRNLG